MIESLLYVVVRDHQREFWSICIGSEPESDSPVG